MCSHYISVVFFLLICTYILYEIHFLSSLSLNSNLSASTYLLHFCSQPSSYYLLYMPIMIVLLSRITDLGPYELMVYTRSKTRTEYILNKLLAVIYYVIGCSIIMLVTSIIIFYCVSAPNANLLDQLNQLQQQGISVLREELAHILPGLIILLQTIILIQSFVALGHLLVFLQIIFRKKSISIMICFSINCLLLLGTKCDLPKWLFNLLPYQYLFFPFFNSTSCLLYAIMYWLFITTGLLFMIIYQTKRTDLFFANYENLFT